MFRLRSQLPQRFVRTAAGAGLTSNGQVVRTQKREFLSLIESKWFSSSKGFGRFTRNRGAKEGESNSSSSTNGTSSNSSSNATKGEKPKFSSNSGNNGSGGSGGKKPKKDGNDFNSSVVSSIVILGGLSFVSMFIGGNTNGREISWQDFQKQLLETGMVDRIIVTNKKVARVVLRAKAYEGETSIHDQVSSGALNNATSTGSQESSSTSTGTSGTYTWSTEGFPAADANATGTAGAAKPDFTRYPSVGNHGRSVTPFYFNIGTVESFERKLEDAPKQLGISSRDYIPVIYIDETDWIEEFTRFLPTLILMGGMMFLARRAMSGGRGDGPGGIFRFGKSPAKRIQKEQVNTTFANVAGCDEAKREIMEFVQFLKDPKKFTDLGAKIPKGALLCGPPGTGKTLLAKATAGEADVPFYTISGSDFVEMFVGVGPSRVRDLFEEARNNAPCIIFIDEIDAVGRQRGKGGFSGGNDERENTLNQLLVEMDGFDKSTNIVVLAGTNRVDILDAALTRPGRFDRQITVDRPDIKGRKQIFEIYLKNITLDGKVEDFSGRLAALTPGFVGADIANICNEAAIIAARRNKKGVQLEDFESATDRVIGGLESRKIMSPEEKKVVAYHEAGHAIAGWFLEHADPLLKVTIVPRGSGALGFAQYLPKELFLRTRDQIMDMVCMALAGRASEEVNFGRVTTGAADDLRRVTQIVYNMVTVYGMNERIGQVAFPKEEGGFPGDRLYSDATAQVMDEEVRQIVAEAYSRTLNLIRARQQDVVKVAELLLSKETITNMDVAELIGRRPFETSKEYDEYLNYGRKPEKQDEAASEPVAEEDATAAPETAEQPSADKDSKAV